MKNLARFFFSALALLLLSGCTMPCEEKCAEDSTGCVPGEPTIYWNCLRSTVSGCLEQAQIKCPENQTCQNGECKQLAFKNCQEIFDSGVTANGYYDIFPDGETQINDYCIMDTVEQTGWTPIDPKHDSKWLLLLDSPILYYSETGGPDCGKWESWKGPIAPLRERDCWGDDWHYNSCITEETDGKETFLGLIEDTIDFPIEHDEFVYNTTTYFLLKENVDWPAGFIRLHKYGYVDDTAAIYIDGQLVFADTANGVGNTNNAITLQAGKWHKISVVTFGYWPDGAWAPMAFGENNSKLSELPEVSAISPSQSQQCAEKKPLVYGPSNEAKCAAGNSPSWCSWKEWLKVSTENTRFATSEDCKNITEKNAVFRMTGDIFGCSYSAESNPFLLNTPNYSYNANCLTDNENTAPSLGPDGKHCEAFAPAKPGIELSLKIDPEKPRTVDTILLIVSFKGGQEKVMLSTTTNIDHARKNDELVLGLMDTTYCKRDYSGLVECVMDVPFEETRLGDKITFKVTPKIGDAAAGATKEASVEITSCPPDSICNSYWSENGPSKTGINIPDAITLLEDPKSCDIIEVCNPTIDHWVDDAEDSCAGKAKTSDEYKECLGLWMINEGLGSGAKIMQKYFAQEISALGLDVGSTAWECAVENLDKCECTTKNPLISEKNHLMKDALGPKPLSVYETWVGEELRNNSCSAANLPANASTEKIKTGTCGDYANVLLTLLRKSGFLRSEAFVALNAEHAYNIVKLEKYGYVIVDTTGNRPNPINPSGHPWCQVIRYFNENALYSMVGKQGPVQIERLYGCGCSPRQSKCQGSYSYSGTFACYSTKTHLCGISLPSGLPRIISKCGTVEFQSQKDTCKGPYYSACFDKDDQECKIVNGMPIVSIRCVAGEAQCMGKKGYTGYYVCFDDTQEECVWADDGQPKYLKKCEKYDPPLDKCKGKEDWSEWFACFDSKTQECKNSYFGYPIIVPKATGAAVTTIETPAGETTVAVQKQASFGADGALNVAIRIYNNGDAAASALVFETIDFAEPISPKPAMDFAETDFPQFLEWSLEISPNSYAEATYTAMPYSPGSFFLPTTKVVIGENVFESEPMQIIVECNNNAVCEWEKFENYENCPSDCGLTATDRLCMLEEEDTRCDPDCMETIEFYSEKLRNKEISVEKFVKMAACIAQGELEKSR